MLDATHFEAMLSGLIPPTELLELVRAQASFHGQAYVSLATLLRSEEEPPSVAFGPPPSMRGGLVEAAGGSATGEVLFTLPSSRELGVTTDHRGRILVTTDNGILAVDPRAQSAEWAVPVAGCHRNVVMQANGSVVFVRGHGVGLFSGQDVTVLGGGLAGSTCLAPHPDGSVWVFAAGNPASRLNASSTRLGETLGDEVRHELALPAATALSSAWVGGSKLLTVGPEFVISTLGTGETRRYTAAQKNPTGLVTTGDGHVITAGDKVTLGRTSLASGEYTQLARLSLRGSVNELSPETQNSVLIASYYGDGPDMPIAVGRLRLTPSSDRSTWPTDSSPLQPQANQQLAFDITAPAPAASSPVVAVSARERRPPSARRVDGRSYPDSRPTLVDVFCGGGGMSLSFHREGYRPLLAVDHDFACAATYAANFGESLVYHGDVAELLMDHVPYSDILVGGLPTQGFSGWGRRYAADPRNSLWRQFLRLVVESRPKAFLMEVAPQFFKSSEFRDLLESNGRDLAGEYGITWDVLSAADFGVPQDRKLGIIIGSRLGHIPLPEPTYARVPNPGQKPWATVRDCLSNVNPDSAGTDLPRSHTQYLGQWIRGEFRGRDLQISRNFTPLSLARYEHIPPGGDIRALPTELLSPHHFGRRGYARLAGVMGRMRWDAPAPAIRSEFSKPEKGRYLHPQWDEVGPRINRPITHYEAALLQDFPDDYLWCGSKSEIARQIANATPSGVAATLARHLKNYL